MMVARRVARPLLAAVFVTGGVDALRNPEPKVEPAEPVAPPVADKLPYLPEDTETLVKVNGAVQVVAGSLLALGRFPRLSALALLASLVPTTAAGHPFWQEQDPEARAAQQVHFVKNLGLAGGLLLAAVDTEGRPGLGWRTRHAGRVGRHALRASRREARLATRSAGRRARLAA